MRGILFLLLLSVAMASLMIHAMKDRVGFHHFLLQRLEPKASWTPMSLGRVVPISLSQIEAIAEDDSSTVYSRYV